MAVAVLVTAGIVRALGQPVGFPPVPLLSAVYLLPVNLVCLVLLRRVLHREGRSVRDLLGFDRSRLGRDTSWGLLWIAVLYVPFALTVLGVMAVLYGADVFSAFETIFVPDVVPTWGFATSLVLGVVAVVTFAPINAPTEELVYRGYAQSGMQAGLGPWLAISISALGFGLQHVFFAATIDAMVVYAAAFFVWGFGSGIIYWRQGRLMPLVIAHFLVNLLTSLPAVLVPFFL